MNMQNVFCASICCIYLRTSFKQEFNTKLVDSVGSYVIYTQTVHKKKYDFNNKRFSLPILYGFNLQSDCKNNYT